MKTVKYIAILLVLFFILGLKHRPLIQSFRIVGINGIEKSALNGKQKDVPDVIFKFYTLNGFAVCEMSEVTHGQVVLIDKFTVEKNKRYHNQSSGDYYILIDDREHHARLSFESGHKIRFDFEHDGRKFTKFRLWTIHEA